ncbi:hypothetical protein OIU78_001634 [Salix suchowensis]|nr:hypothetical protein OIU78_001634 [Salix suchowensis]
MQLSMFACYYALIFIFYSYLVEVIQGQSSECSCYLQSNNDADDDEPHLEFAGGNVHLITTKERWDQKLSEARRDDKIVLANFSATWCGPCRQIAPFYNELSESYPSLMFLLIDVDELSVSCKLYSSFLISHYFFSFIYRGWTVITRLFVA